MSSTSQVDAFRTEERRDEVRRRRTADWWRRWGSEFLGGHNSDTRRFRRYLALWKRGGHYGRYSRSAGPQTESLVSLSLPRALCSDATVRRIDSFAGRCRT